MEFRSSSRLELDSHRMMTKFVFVENYPKKGVMQHGKGINDLETALNFLEQWLFISFNFF